ncbi:MAG: hypothetical protein IJA16_00880 [Clostridia bacterium]|nr:hypothetical protein [Clostridia bacterium]
MKKILKLMSVYIGLIIGAGFASGREVLEYFNLKSNTSSFPIVLAAFLFAAISYIILSKASENGISDYDTYIDSVAGALSPAIRWFMLIYMFCGLFVMFSGSAALIYSLTPMPEIAGALLMAFICFCTISFDLKGIVAINAILVPLMICGIIYVSVCVAVFGDALTFSAEQYISGGALLSAVCYSAYNTVTAGAVLVPLSQGADKKTIRTASVLGGFVIGALIMLVWTVQGMNFDAVWDSELPMLELAALCGKTCKRVYSAVMFMAICTTAVSYGFGLMAHFSDRIKTTRQRMGFAAVICLCAIPPAMYGFSNLVAQLYSAFGYIGMVWMIWIVIDRYKGAGNK